MRDKAIITQGYQLHGIVGYVFNKPSPSKHPSTAPIYHAFYSYSEDNSYTNSLAEQNNYISLGYQDMGISWYMYSKPESCRTALYSFFNPTSYEHYYTTNATDVTVTEEIGYLAKGIIGYLYTNSTQGGSPLYELAQR